MRVSRFNPPDAKPQVVNPDLWRPVQYEDELRSPDKLWLDRGECIDPELTALIKSLIADIPTYAFFSYPTPGPLYRKLAALLDVPVEHLMLTRGSDGGIYSQMFGAEIHSVPYSLLDGRPYIEVSAFISAIKRARPKLVGLPNPDNPTGFSFDEKDLRAIIEAAGESGALMLIDEAYYPFLEQTALPWVSEYGHLIIARTFSKAWGMAGLRLGYTVAQPAITTMLNKVRTMVEADGFAMALVERMLDHEDAVKASLKRLKEGRALFAAEMQAMGFHAFEMSGNFVHVDFGDKRADVEEALRKIATYRVFPIEPLENFLRFTTTTPELFQRVIDAIRPHAAT